MSLLATLLTLAILGSPPTSTIDIASSPDEIRIGDPIDIEMVVTVPPGTDAEFPEPGETWGSAEIRSADPITTEVHADGSRTLKRRMTVVIFETGEVTLPGPPIRFTNPDSSDSASIAVEPADPLVISVTSLLPEGEEIPEPKPPTPPRPLPVGDAFLWTSGIFGLLSLGLLGLLLRRRLTAVSAANVPFDPLATLITALESLRRLSDLEDATTGISLHLRRFFGSTLAFPAAESTTSEIRGRLRELDLPQSLTTRTEGLLRQCDGVKYARQGVSPEDVGHGIGEAAAIATETIQALAPPGTDEDEAQ